MTTSEAVNGMNTYTGTVHRARRDGRHLVQTCGLHSTAYTGQRASLVKTTADVTCKRCLNVAAKPAAGVVAKPAAKTGTGSTTWGVFDADGTLRTWDTTKRAAQAKADRLGFPGLEVRKL